MELLVVRHAIAEERDVWARTGRADSERPLTREGRRKMRLAAKGLREIVPSLDRLAASPFARAWETAEILAERYDGIAIAPLDALEPERSPDELLDWLAAHEEGARVAVVGHEPHLSALVTWLLTGSAGHIIELKKGATCMLAIHGKPRQGDATLLWAIAPGQLRQLGR